MELDTNHSINPWHSYISEIFLLIFKTGINIPRMKFVIIETFEFVRRRRKSLRKSGPADLDPIKPLCHSMIDPEPNILHHFHPFSPQNPLNRDKVSAVFGILLGLRLLTDRPLLSKLSKFQWIFIICQANISTSKTCVLPVNKEQTFNQYFQTFQLFYDSSKFEWTPFVFCKSCLGLNVRAASCFSCRRK